VRDFFGKRYHRRFYSAIVPSNVRCLRVKERCFGAYRVRRSLLLHLMLS